MSENIFTPGPWEVRQHGNLATFSIVGKNGDHTLAVVGVSPGYIRPVEDEGNARLIAAAPDMLDALEHAAHSLCVTHCASCLPHGYETGMAIFFKEGCPRGCLPFECDMAKWWDLIRKVIGEQK